MDPRVQAVKDYFNDLEIERNGTRGKIVKINMFPNAKKFFLTVEDLVELAELNNKYRDHYIDVNTFCTNLCAGKYSIGSGMTHKLKGLHDRTKELEDELNFKMEMEENMIEEDMNNLKDMLMTQVEEYFTEIKAKLKHMFHKNNADLKENLSQANNILKQELLSTLNDAEFFDLNKFFVQFNEMKDTPDEFEEFLSDYINNDETIQFSQSAMTQFEKMSPIFNEEFDIDSRMSTYVLNIEKLSHHFVPHEDDMATVLEGFSKSIIKQVDTTMMKAKHFTNGDGILFQDFNETGSPGQNTKGRTVMSSPRKSGTKKRPTNEIKVIKFKNVQDLQYDHLKFTNSNVGTTILELHGDNFKQSSCEHMGKFLGSLYQLDTLKMNFSM